MNLKSKNSQNKSKSETQKFEESLREKYAQQEALKKSAGRYTLPEAAKLLADKTGNRYKYLFLDMVRAVRDGRLKFYAPGQTAPARPFVNKIDLSDPAKDAGIDVSDLEVAFGYEELNWQDLNAWIDDCYASLKFRFPPSSDYLREQSGGEEPQPQPAPVVDGASNGSDVQKIPMKKAALIAALQHEWPSIVADISESSRNGLTEAAHTGKHGYWYESRARAWAVSHGKIRQSAAGPRSASWLGPVTRHQL